MSLGDFIDDLLGRAPLRYDRRNDPRRRLRNPKERKVLSIHVDEDEYWRDEHSAGITDIHIEMHGIKRILLLMLLIMASSGLLSLSQILGLIGH